MSTMLLISSDPTLVASVEETVASIDAIDLEVAEDIDHAGLTLGYIPSSTPQLPPSSTPRSHTCGHDKVRDIERRSGIDVPRRRRS